MVIKDISKIEKNHSDGIKIKNLTLKIENKTVFSDFSINFKAKKITGIIAPSGWGKTTLLNWISKNFKNVSYAFQDLRLLENETVLKNITIPLNAENIKINKNSVESLPDCVSQCLTKLELLDLASKKAAALSGGERQRVSIARALVFNSDILLLDEPFQNLDYSLKINIMNYIKQLQQQFPRTVLFVTHHKAEADYLCDEIITFE